MCVINKVRPTERHPSLWPNFEALSILFDFDKVIGGIVDIKGMFGPYFFNIGEGEDIGVFYLLHVDADMVISLVVS
jgi:hypothetical protein